MSFAITKRLEWDAGHRVPLHASKCRSPHGHRYAAEITCTASQLTREGFVIDFGIVKSIIGGWLDENWDHTMILQRGDPLIKALQSIDEPFRPIYILNYAPTAENMARHLFDAAQELLRGHFILVARVRIFETPTCWADWCG